MIRLIEIDHLFSPFDWDKERHPETFKAQIVVDKILGFAEFKHAGFVYTEIYTDGRIFHAYEHMDSFEARFKRKG